MNWQLLIGISVIFESFGRITQRTMMRGKASDPIASAVAYQLVSGVVLGLLAFYIGFSVPDLMPLWPHLVLTPAIWGITNLFIFKSLQTTEASVFTILFTSRTLVAIFLSIFLLNEVFTMQQTIGAALIVFSVFLISWRGKRISMGKGELFAFLGAITFAIGVINDSFIVRTVPVLPYLSYNFLSAGLILLLFQPDVFSRIAPAVRNRRFAVGALLLGCLYAVSSSSGLLAYQVGKNAAQLSAIFPVTNIIIVFLAILLLKEKSQLHLKVIAAILSFVGILLVV